MKHCIVSMEIAGPSKNGGIGTHCLYQALFLAQKLRRETVALLATPVQSETAEHWKDWMGQRGVRLVLADELDPFCPHDPPECDTRRYLKNRALKVYGWLRKQDFDVIHFQENNGLGCLPAQAKRAGLAFENTLLTTTIHSPDEWIRDANRLWTHFGADDLETDWIERRSVELSDWLISPVKYMRGWIERAGWRLPRNNIVLPYLIDGVQPAGTDGLDADTLIFFGRLETRKGLEIFLQALEILKDEPDFATRPVRVLFVGKGGTAEGRDALECIREKERGIKPQAHTWELLTSLGHFEAMDLLRRNKNALVLLPSLVDNSPFTAIEAIGMGLNVIAARSGGIPELFGDSGRLFEPTGPALADAIRDARRSGLSPFSEKRHTQEKAESAWGAFIEKIEAQAEDMQNAPAPPPPDPPEICVAVVNEKPGARFADALDSLASQSESAFTVIAIDRWPQDEKTAEAWKRLEKRYFSKGWQFVAEPIADLGKARNLAYANARAEYVLFMDADCAAEPRMVEALGRAMRSSGADMLMCWTRETVEDKEVGARFPVGGSIELAQLEDIFDDHCFIVRRAALEKHDGFVQEDLPSTRNRSLLARMLLAGEEADVAPELLVSKHMRPEERRPVCDPYWSRLAGMQPRLALLEPWERRLAKILVGLDREHRRLLGLTWHLQSENKRLSEQLENPERNTQTPRKNGLLGKLLGRVKMKN